MAFFHCLTTIGAILLFATQATAGTYTYTAIFPSRGDAFFPRAINDHEEIVGNEGTLGFTWSGSALNEPISGGLYGVNDSGIAVGTHRRVVNGRKQDVFFIYNVATQISTDVPTPRNASNPHINANGILLGTSYSKSKGSSCFTLSGATEHVFRPRGSSNCYANGLNDSGVVVGTFTTGTGPSQGFTYNGSRFTILNVAGATVTKATAISNDGSVAGSYSDHSGVYHGFIWSKGTFLTFDFPAGTQGMVSLSAIVDGPVVAGTFGTTSTHGFLYSPGKFTQIDAPGTEGTDITGINANLSLAGYWTIGGQFYPFTAQCPANQRPCTQ